MAWLFGSTFGIMLTGLVMLSTRAALYNPVLRPIRRKRREREFKEYTEYMSEHYDTSKWKMDPESKDKGAIQTTDTFETQEADSSKSSSRSHEHDEEIFNEEDPEDSSSQPSDENRSFATALEPSTPLSKVASVARAAVVMAGNNLGMFKAPDPEVEYYSSDSEDDEEEEESLTGLSTISGLVNRFFVVGDSRSDNGDATRRNVYGWRDVPPAFLTPRRRRLRQRHASTDEHDSPKHQEEEKEEMVPLSPLETNKSLPKTPSKKFKSLRRTKGAANL
jgi:hypothetical protein